MVSGVRRGGIHEPLRVTSRVLGALDLDAPVERLAGGFTFTEGPIWHPRDQYLLFSDMPADVRRRYDERGGVREVMNRPTNATA